jgi:hypothetical protein
MSHTRKGGQASDQDSNSGPGRHGNNSGHIYPSAPHQRQGQAHMWVTLLPPTPTLVDPNNRPNRYSQRICADIGGC